MMASVDVSLAGDGTPSTEDSEQVSRLGIQLPELMSEAPSLMTWYNVVVRIRGSVALAGDGEDSGFPDNLPDVASVDRGERGMASSFQPVEGCSSHRSDP